MELQQNYNRAGLAAFTPFIAPLLITSALWVMRVNEINVIEWLAALILIAVPWWSYCAWKAKPYEKFPLLGVVALMHWVYFALPLFWGDRYSPRLDSGKYAIIGREYITQAMVLATVGVFSMWVGGNVRIGRKWSPKSAIDMDQTRVKWSYLQIIVLVGMAISPLESFTFALGAEFRQILVIFQSIIPTIAFAIILQKYLRGEKTSRDRMLIIGYLAFQFIAGLSSGWLGTSTLLLVLCGSVYVAERRKIPWVAVILVLVWIMFFQVGKASVRERYWSESGVGVEAQDTNRVERLVYWAQESLNRWDVALNGSSNEELGLLANELLKRISLLSQAANVVESTPSDVPYQYGRLYYYFLVTLIPRFVWPDKPSVSEANQFYQLSYGLTTEENLSQVSIAIGFLTESYINFGWLGVIFIMFLVGVLLDFVQQTFLSASSGRLFNGIGLVFLIGLINIESQLAQYIGGLIQILIAVTLVFIPIIRKSQRISITVPNERSAPTDLKLA